jgi:serine/threonine protein kinase
MRQRPYVAYEPPSQPLPDRFRVDGLIGRGPGTEVYEAYDELLDREVAVKVFPADLDATACRRIADEARALDRLNHRRLVSVYDGGIHLGRPYLVMQLIRGTSLSKRLRQGPMFTAEAVVLIALLADGLAHVHAQGVVHRDVKPSNIMLTQSKDGAQDIKIVDFGIAARTHPAPNRGSGGQDALEMETETMTGNIVGTVAYLAPERVSGAPDSPAADLYSLGVLFYQLLSGRLPFDASEPIAVLCAHADGRADPLPADIPPLVAEQCFRLMARDPADRPPSGAAAAAELRALDVEHPERLWPQRHPAAERGKALMSKLRTGPGQQRAAAGPRAGRQRGRRVGRQVKALVAAGSFATVATAGCTAWLVSGFGTQAAAGTTQQTTTSHSAAPSSSNPGSVHAVSVVISPSQPGTATTPAAHSGPIAPVHSAPPKAGQAKDGDNGGGAGHGKHKGHG